MITTSTDYVDIVNGKLSFTAAPGPVVVTLLRASEPPASETTSSSTSTALGTIPPMLKQEKLTGTKVGDSVMSHGAIGEVASYATVD